MPPTALCTVLFARMSKRISPPNGPGKCEKDLQVLWARNPQNIAQRASEHESKGHPRIRDAGISMKQELQPMLEAARTLPPEQLPRLLGDLEEVRATALARLSAPGSHQTESDKLLDVSEAAARLGISKDYLYRNHSDFSFTRRVGRSLRFSASGIENYIQQRNGLTARRQRAILSARGSCERTLGQARQ
jgi:predicted DNA-binding transcriptional regulator AlpA